MAPPHRAARSRRALPPYAGSGAHSIHKKLDAWRGYKKEKVPEGLYVEDGVLTEEGVRQPPHHQRTSSAISSSIVGVEADKGPNAGVFDRGAKSAQKIYLYGTRATISCLMMLGHAPCKELGSPRLDLHHRTHPSPAGDREARLNSRTQPRGLLR